MLTKLPLLNALSYNDSGLKSRGAQYALGGRVRYLYQMENEFYYEVRGNEDYNVIISPCENDTQIIGRCSCPFFDQYDNCKHIYAVIFSEEMNRDDLFYTLFPHTLQGKGKRRFDNISKENWRTLLTPKVPTDKALYKLHFLISHPLYHYQGDSLRLEIFYTEPLKKGKTSVLKKLKKDDGAQQELFAEQKEYQLLQKVLAFQVGSLYDYRSVSDSIAVPFVYAIPIIKEAISLNVLYTGDKKSPRPVTFFPYPLTDVIEVEERDSSYEIKTKLNHDIVFSPKRSIDHHSYYRGKLILDKGVFYEMDGERINLPEISVPSEDKHELIERLYQTFKPDRLLLPETLKMKLETGICITFIEIFPPSITSDLIQGQLMFGYEKNHFTTENPDSSYITIKEGQPVQVMRDFNVEKKHISDLEGLGILKINGKIEFHADQFTKILAELSERSIDIVFEKCKVKGPQSKSIRVSTGIDWFQVDVKLEVGDQQLGIKEILEKSKKGTRFIKINTDELVYLEGDWIKKLLTMYELGEMDGDKLQLKQIQMLMIDELIKEEVKGDKAYYKIRENLQKGAHNKKLTLPKTFKGKLRPYQKEGVLWLEFLESIRVGGCLADEMGLGKTVQILAHLLSYKARKKKMRTLIVAPRSLLFNWRNEITRFTNLTSTPYEEVRKNLDSTSSDIILITYAIARLDLLYLKDQHFDYIILDEGQMIKNESAQTSKALAVLKADHRLVLSGTPVENHYKDLFSLFRFLNPELFRKKITSSHFSEDAHSLDALLQGLRPFILRRTKKEVLTDLPEKSEQTLFCEMRAEENKLYQATKNYFQEKIFENKENYKQEDLLKGLLRLRQASNHMGLIDKGHEHYLSSKLELLLEKLGPILENGEKALIFSSFTSLLKLLEYQLAKRNIGYCYLDGSSRNREEIVTDFKTGSKPLFLISLKAGGVGLNLTEASYCFILDPWWNPAVESQAIDRAHRIGQKKNLFAYRLVSKDTIEEKIIELQLRKREMEKKVFEKGVSMKDLSLNDFQFLFS